MKGFGFGCFWVEDGLRFYRVQGLDPGCTGLRIN